jgi:hypothetical protein
MAAASTQGTATVQFFDGPHDPLTFFGPDEVLGAKMHIFEGPMTGGLGWVMLFSGGRNSLSAT